MTKKGKESGKEKGCFRGKKTKQSQQESSRELPTIVEEDVNGADGQILDFLSDLKQVMLMLPNTNHWSRRDVNVNIERNCKPNSNLGGNNHSTGKTIEALAKKVSELDTTHKWERKIESISFGEVKDFGKDICVEVSDISTDLNVGTSGNPCKRKLEFVNFSSHDIDILYMIKQRHHGSPFAFWSHNRSEMTSEETPTASTRERLYDDSHYDGSRFRFLYLRPGCELYDDVLNMVVGMCTGQKKDKTKWWLLRKRG
ncbi:hypothetical protein PIB30_044244 [Stylosanthes scabra]|uniref:Uncharacterized protein n=1 Tax=Stylosanthes scabra TaxID=79078 RepID=A0ABU6XDQ2_9FABA|nr:hypothetical protein [Stylosanthes scabra]